MDFLRDRGGIKSESPSAKGGPTFGGGGAAIW